MRLGTLLALFCTTPLSIAYGQSAGSVALQPFHFPSLIPPTKDAPPTLGAPYFRLDRPGSGHTLVEFGATWCHPCAAVFDSVRVLAAHGPPGLRIVAISWDDDPAKLWQFLQPRQPLPFPVYVDTMAPYELEKRPTLGLPAVLLVDARGRIVRRASDSPAIFALLRRIRAEGLRGLTTRRRGPPGS